jgi:hypothetical protein
MAFDVCWLDWVLRRAARVTRTVTRPDQRKPQETLMLGGVFSGTRKPIWTIRTSINDVEMTALTMLTEASRA